MPSPCSSLLKKYIRGELMLVGDINLCGSIKPIHNPVTLAELAVEKVAKALLVPVHCRRKMFDLSDELATKLDIGYYTDVQGALFKALEE